MSPIIAPLGYAGSISRPIGFIISEMKEKESRPLGKMLLDHILAGLISMDIILSESQRKLLSNLYHETVNKFYVNFNQRTPLMEAIKIATWLNSLYTPPKAMSE